MKNKFTQDSSANNLLVLPSDLFPYFKFPTEQYLRCGIAALKILRPRKFEIWGKDGGMARKLFAEESPTQNCGFFAIVFIIQKIRGKRQPRILKNRQR